jgi:hypothetical protein
LPDPRSIQSRINAGTKGACSLCHGICSESLSPGFSDSLIQLVAQATAFANKRLDVWCIALIVFVLASPSCIPPRSKHLLSGCGKLCFCLCCGCIGCMAAMPFFQ